MNLPSTLRTALLGMTCTAATLAVAQTARLQVVHNCADLNASVVDVYVNGLLAIPDFEFRTATPFIDLPAGVPLEVAIAPGSSSSAAEALFTADVTLADGETYLAVASGTLELGGYEPATPFSLEVFSGARETAQGTGTDVLVFHGCTDAPTVDVFESAVVSTTVVDDLSYGEFDGYLELPTLDFTLQVRTADGATTVASYAAPLATLGLEGAALTVLASGFLNPAVNSNGAAFGLWVALASGGALVELPVVTSTSELNAAANVRLWPNPATDQINLEMGNGGNLEVRLLDAAGRTVRAFPEQSSSSAAMLTLPVDGIPAGAYRLLLSSDGAISTLPILITR
ncbi:MAG: DUF4397 domain-containing protein [Flavobacteriales bacterium]|nr:DUF4397 domain-containing protein [Flavobacteriales bacterium]